MILDKSLTHYGYAGKHFRPLGSWVGFWVGHNNSRGGEKENATGTTTDITHLTQTIDE